MLGLWRSIGSWFSRGVESWLKCQFIFAFLVRNLFFGPISSPFGLVQVVADVLLLLPNPFVICDIKWEIGRVIHARRNYARLTKRPNSLLLTSTAYGRTRSCPIRWTLPVNSRLETTLFNFLVGSLFLQGGDFQLFCLRSHMELVRVVFDRKVVPWSINFSGFWSKLRFTSLILGHFLSSSDIFKLLFHVIFPLLFCVQEFIKVLDKVFLHGIFAHWIDSSVNVKITVFSQTLLIFYWFWELQDRRWLHGDFVEFLEVTQEIVEAICLDISD